MRVTYYLWYSSFGIGSVLGLGASILCNLFGLYLNGGQVC